MSVQDGVYSNYDSTGKLQSTTIYKDGIDLGTKEYDQNGVLITYRYQNYDADSSVNLTYIGYHVFRKQFYPPGDGNHQFTEYYPGERLNISNAEPLFRVNFISKPSDTQTVILIANKAITINGFKMKGYCKSVTRITDNFNFL